MRNFYVIGFLVLACCDTLAQCSIKLASIHAGAMQLHLAWVASIIHQGWLYFAIAGYIGSFFTWMTLLKHAPVGPAFAASHLEKVSVLAVSVIWLGERLSIVQAAGCILILGGIALLASAEPKMSHEPG
ncbi:MAG TPA: EamA family transporter [Vicinamibacterales bacterium]